MVRDATKKYSLLLRTNSSDLKRERHALYAECSVDGY